MYKNIKNFEANSYVSSLPSFHSVCLLTVNFFLKFRRYKAFNTLAEAMKSYF